MVFLRKRRLVFQLLGNRLILGRAFGTALFCAFYNAAQEEKLS
jgi:hypothetical protein